MVRNATPEQAEPGEAVANGAENRVSGRCFASPENHEAPDIGPILRDAAYAALRMRESDL
jgi:hypothetical protein